MAAALFPAYTRTLLAGAAIALAVWLLYGDSASTIYPSLLGVFEWMESTWFGVIGRTWGAAFAFVEAIHLLGLAMLGGCVIASDGRLLGLVLSDIPPRVIFDRTHKIFVLALTVLVLTGVFMACGVATKIYYLQVFWFKMLALSAGTAFYFFIRRPLLQHELDDLNPVVTRLVAVASMLVWFMVAATGRWIGFSG